jgi:antitoxin component YwqK of YwqJK toxin-antitoxin module
MKRINKLYQIDKLFFTLILMYSCVSENKEFIKDENGVIILKCELKNGIREGKCYEYYPNGTTKSTSSWIAGVQNGKRIEYFENGSMRETSMWVDGKLDGESLVYSNGEHIHWVRQFMDGKPFGIWIQYSEGFPISSIQYAIVKDERHWMNQWWAYDSFGQVKKEESHYFSIYSEKGDTVKTGESGEIKIKLEASLYNGFMKLVLGDFDSKFNPKNINKLDTINCVGFECTVKYKFEEKGTQFVQGIILDCKEEKGYNEKGEYTKYHQHEIYFVKAFEVY